MIFAANFKMNHTRRSAAEWMEALEAMLSGDTNGDALYCFPPATALLPSSGRITVGVQNAYPSEKGAYTGEIGLEQLEEFGIDTILIGHSERREILGESQEIVAEKFRYFSERGFSIVYCVGEPLEVREQGEEAIYEYLWEEFVGIDTDYAKLIVAYEPIWAIGTGRSARVEEIAAVHAELRRRIKGPLLYGGSVNPDNIAAIAAIDNVDGVLVGSASLKAESFFSLIRRSREG
jgi:triosephosphate isomerase